MTIRNPFLSNNIDDSKVIDIVTEDERQEYHQCGHYNSKKRMCIQRSIPLRALINQYRRKPVCDKCKMFCTPYRSKRVSGRYL